MLPLVDDTSQLHNGRLRSQSMQRQPRPFGQLPHIPSITSLTCSWPCTLCLQLQQQHGRLSRAAAGLAARGALACAQQQ